MSTLTSLRGRIAAVGGVIVLVIVAGVWVTLTHASAHATGGSGTHPTAHKPSKAPVPPLQVVSLTPARRSSGVDGTSAIKIQFSSPVAADSPLPAVAPNIPGSWQGAGTSTLEFVPTVGFSQLTRVTVKVPGGASGVRSAKGGLLAAPVQFRYQTGAYSSARLDQLLGQLGYLPVNWAPTAEATSPADSDQAGQLAAAYSPPAGDYSWQSGYPVELHSFWDGGSPSGLIVKGAVMAFESDHGLAMDGVPGLQVWSALLTAVAHHQVNGNGYTYAIAAESSPETLTIWHDGRIVQQSPANTGIQAAPTTVGTAPVYLRYRNQIMRGTNPDGSKYADPVQYVAYFRSGEAVHYFPRGSYGFPQSLGCVELNLTDAAHAWPYLTYGSLVTVERGALTPAGSPTA
ncbi:MAG TPA: L,D-transpeptidase family protein [Streptosporangiaceae bacterium]